MSVWKKFEEIVSRGDEEKFLKAIRNNPELVRLAYATAITISQMSLNGTIDSPTVLYALCSHYKQNCRRCLAYRDKKCWLTSDCPVEPMVFVKRLYRGIMKSVPEKYWDGSNKSKS